MPHEWWKPFFEGAYGDVQIAHVANQDDRAEVDLIERRLALRPGARALDIPCGVGRHALELARRGYEVCALDFNARVIEEARRRADEAGMSIDYRVGDMRSAELPRGLGGAFCWFGSFGYFDDAGNQAFLAHVAEALRSGGRFAIDTVCTETIYPRFRTRDWRWLGAGEARGRSIEEREYDVATGVLRSTWTHQREGEEIVAVSEMRLYSFRELAARLRAAGFVDVEGFDGSSDAPFGLGASRLTIVARRA